MHTKNQAKEREIVDKEFFYEAKFKSVIFSSDYNLEPQNRFELYHYTGINTLPQTFQSFNSLLPNAVESKVGASAQRKKKLNYCIFNITEKFFGCNPLMEARDFETAFVQGLLFFHDLLMTMEIFRFFARFSHQH